MSDQFNAILNALSRLEAGQAKLEAGQTRLEALQIGLRADLMERLDRSQARVDAMFNDIAVNWHSGKAIERKVEADREEIREVVGMVNTLTRMVRALENRLAIVEERP